MTSDIGLDDQVSLIWVYSIQNYEIENHSLFMSLGSKSFFPMVMTSLGTFH